MIYGLSLIGFGAGMASTFIGAAFIGSGTKGIAVSALVIVGVALTGGCAFVAEWKRPA